MLYVITKLRINKRDELCINMKEAFPSVSKKCKEYTWTIVRAQWTNNLEENQMISLITWGYRQHCLLYSKEAIAQFFSCNGTASDTEQYAQQKRIHPAWELAILDFEEHERRTFNNLKQELNEVEL